MLVDQSMEAGMLPVQRAEIARAPRRMDRFHRHTCLGCRKHPARFQYRGEVRADRDHTLCFRCYRAELNRLRARALAA
jgi:hypothetical protein